MKDRKLLIPVRCTTRKFYLHSPPSGRNDWHVRFTPPAVDGVSGVVFRSTGTKEIAAAKRIAAQLRGQSGGVANLHSGHFLTPVHGWKSSDFGWRFDPYYKVWQLHAGVDLAAAGGTPIYAAGDGKVVQAGWSGGYGNYTCIYHGQYQGKGLSTCYGHQSAILVHVGQQVHRGDVIGRVGTTGASTGDHLHFEVRVNGTPVQPLDYLNGCLC